jgi:hypothetical protein
MGSIEQNFREFHENNPEVYDELVALARQTKEHGFETYGIRPLVEVLRWHYDIATTDENCYYKINANYNSRYARLIMEQEEDLKEFFRTRALKTE